MMSLTNSHGIDGYATPMEILLIVALAVLVGVVLLRRRWSGRAPDTDLSTGNPPSSKNIDDI
ncbi:hypothetical protein [Nocardia acidivorans]|uniref:hypothetical protein n=1 Tax=Nocardia acidivorans TaxID=404580 RepID=UPI00083283B2|nr:hypothetical protein [Nocardia acidivorans]